MKALILASGVSRPRKPEKSSMGFAENFEVLQIRQRLLAGFWLGGDLDLLIDNNTPLGALTRADLKWNLEEKLALALDIIFLEKGKKECFSRNRVFEKRNLMMTPDPVELKRLHLADLVEALMRCAFFSHSLS